MLFSTSARFNAARAMNNASYGVMQNYTQMSNAVSNNTFGGENSLTMLHEMDKKLSLDLASNSFLYKLASLQEKWAKKHQEHNNSLNVLA